MGHLLNAMRTRAIPLCFTTEQNVARNYADLRLEVFDNKQLAEFQAHSLHNRRVNCVCYLWHPTKCHSINITMTHRLQSRITQTNTYRTPRMADALFFFLSRHFIVKDAYSWRLTCLTYNFSTLHSTWQYADFIFALPIFKVWKQTTSLIPVPKVCIICRVH